MHLVEKEPRAVGEVRAKRNACMTLPRSQEPFADTLSLSFGDDKRIARPGAFSIQAANADAHRHERTCGNDCGSLANNPVRRIPGGIRRISARPVPPETYAIGRLRAKRAPIELFNATPIVGAVPVDVCHEGALAGRPPL